MSACIFVFTCIINVIMMSSAFGNREIVVYLFNYPPAKHLNLPLKLPRR
jgi:hypothetical protein